MAAGQLYIAAKRKTKRAPYKLKRRKRKSNIPRSLVVKTPGGIPPRLRTKLMWIGRDYGSISSATVYKDQIRLNSLYDPDFLNTLGNDQAQGRDRLADIYNNYYVRHVTVVLDIAANGYTAETSGIGTVSAPACALIHRIGVHNNTSTTPTYLEGMPGTVSNMIAVGNQKRIVYKCNLMKLQGCNDPNPLKNKDFGGVSGDSSTPSSISWMVLEYEAPGAGAGVVLQWVQTVKVIFDIEYCNVKYATLDTN